MADQPRVLGRVGQDPDETHPGSHHEFSQGEAGYLDDGRYAYPESEWSKHDWQHEFEVRRHGLSNCLVSVFDVLMALFKLSFNNWRALVAAVLGWMVARFVGLGFVWKTAAALAGAFMVIAYEAAQSMLAPSS